jgi:hypothetical protein
MITFIHVGDPHYSKDTQALAATSLETAIDIGTEKRIDFWALPGDLEDRGIQASDAGGLNRLKDLIQRLLDVAPIAAVSGTETHDLPGCYRVFEDMVGKGGGRFFLLTPDRPCFLDVGSGSLGKCMILGCPEPQRADFLAGASGLSAEEAIDRVRAGIKAIMVRLGDIRREHQDLPCVLLLHGSVRGSMMANGELSEGGLEITAEDLALVGADYIACNDIHLAQQIGVDPEKLVRPGIPWKITGLPAFYGGSLYPVNWGERDQKCLNLVQIVDDVEADNLTEHANGGVYLTRWPVGHPPRNKVVLTWPAQASPADYLGMQTWFVIKAPEAEAKALDPAEILTGYLAQGALDGSRVDIDPIPVEAQRAKEITEKDTLRDKVVIAAKALGKSEPTEAILAKADDLEREGRKEGVGITRRDIIAEKLRLSGHIALQKRSDADEAVLDLSKYGPGVIPLIAPNGSGKTALKENFHPFLTEFTDGRNGNLRDNFCLRDSARETWYREAITGDRYRSLLEIDAVTKTGGITATLFHTPVDGVEVKLSNGKTQADYLEKTMGVFGTESMYVRCGFWMQEPSKKYPRLRRTTEGQKKEIFNEFVGNERFQVYSKKAGKKATDHGDNAARERLQADTMQRQADELPSVRISWTERTLELDAQRVTVAGILERGKRAKAELEVLAAAVKAQEMAEAEVKSLREQKAQKEKIVADAEAAIIKYTEAAKSKEINQKVVTTWDALKAEEAVENGKITEAGKERDRKRTAHAAILKTHNENVRAVEGTKANLRTESARVAGDRKALQADIKHLEEELKDPLAAFDGTCFNCGELLKNQKLSAEQTKYDAKVQRRAATEKKLADLRADLVANGKKIAELDAKLAAIVIPTALPDLVLDPVDERGLKRVKDTLAVLGDIEVARKSLSTAAKAETQLEETRKQKATSTVEASRLGDAVMKLEATIDDRLKGKHDAKSAERDKLFDEYTADKERLASLQTLVTEKAERITALEVVSAEIAGHREAAEVSDVQAAEWRYMEWICGPDGIQALELDALGPSIAIEANKLLDVLKNYPQIDNHYDRVKFETQRESKGDGHKIEDFTILCHDTKPRLPESMQWVDFAKTSVGEAVWLDLALDFAFGIVRERNQGTRLLVYLQDESDAALDEVRRRAFFTMLQAAHDASGRYQTIVTTHSLEAQQMFSQCIYLEDLVTKPASLAKDEQEVAA